VSRGDKYLGDKHMVNGDESVRQTWQVGDTSVWMLCVVLLGKTDVEMCGMRCGDMSCDPTHDSK